MKPLLDRLKDECLVSDGAMGTQLLEKGLPSGQSPEFWGINNEKIVYSIHKSYIDAGADMIITNTFGANRIKLKKFNLENQIEKINSESVQIAKKAAKDNVYVIGDIGPTGEYLEPAGSLKPEDCYKAFLEQARIFEKEGVDAIIIETMTDMEELKAAIMAVKDNIKKIPLIISMSFNKTKAGAYRTTSGISIPQMVNDSLLQGADVIGTNCGVDISDMIEIILQMRPLSSAFIIAKPNAGKPQLVKDKTVYEQSLEEFAKFLPQLIKAGPNIIGGCCGTTPKHIKKIKEAVRKNKIPQSEMNMKQSGDNI